MGRRHDPFVTLVEAAEILNRTPEEVNSLCNEGFIRRRSTSDVILVHIKDVEEVRETNFHNIARPKELVQKILVLEREVASLRKTVDLIGKVNGLLSSSLDDMDNSRLFQLSEVVSQFLDKETYSLDEMLQFSEIFLRIADSDIVRLNDVLGTHDTWRNFYELCLKMLEFSRECDIPKCRDLETAQALLHRGLRNVRSIGVLFVENSSFFLSSKELLEKTMGHDIAGFDMLIKKLKNEESGATSFVQNT